MIFSGMIQDTESNQLISNEVSVSLQQRKPLKTCQVGQIGMLRAKYLFFIILPLKLLHTSVFANNLNHTCS